MNDRVKRTLTLLRHELLMLLRDKRTIIFSIILPLVVLPFMLWISKFNMQRQEKRQETTTYQYAVTGSEGDLIKETLAGFKAPDGEGEKKPTFSMKEVETEDPAKALEEDQIHFYLEGLTAQEAKDSAASDEETDDSSYDELTVPLARIVFRADRDISQAGARKMRDRLIDLRKDRRFALLLERGFPLQESEVGAVEDENVATQAEIGGSFVGKFITALLMMFIFMGGSVAAIDSIAGEKERGTLETLLTTAAGRIEIVTAKQLSIVVVALAITVIQVLNLLVYIGFGLFKLPANVSLHVTPGNALLLFLLFLPAVILLASFMLYLSGKAKTYKEAQLYFFPVFLFGTLPALVPLIPGIGLRSAFVAVPIANTALSVREVLVGIYDWPFLLIGWIITSGAAYGVVRMTVRSLDTERLITVGGGEVSGTGPEDRLSQIMFRWVLVVWAILFITATNVEFLAPLERQILFNLVFLMGGSTLFLIHRFKLDPKKVLALRKPKAVVWLAVLLGGPAGHIAGIGVFKAANLVFPVPEKFMEAFGEGLGLSDKPIWVLLFWIAIMPGIFEELFFRGVLLHAWRRRFHPAVLCLVVSCIFGFFHVSLYRLIPTTYIGMLLAALVLLTGSIFPAMVWHALNNASALLAAHFDIPVDDLSWWVYLSAFAVLGLVFWILYRTRTPYPELKSWRKKRPSRGGVIE